MSQDEQICIYQLSHKGRIIFIGMTKSNDLSQKFATIRHAAKKRSDPLSKFVQENPDRANYEITKIGHAACLDSAKKLCIEYVLAKKPLFNYVAELDKIKNPEDCKKWFEKPLTVYGIKFKGDFVYVGVTSRDLKIRMIDHFRAAQNGHFTSKKLHGFIRENPNQSDYEIMKLDSASGGIKALEVEREWIERLGTLNGGLNMNRGGYVSGSDHYLYGKPVSRHIVEASVASRIGKKLSDEHREKIRQGNTGKRCDSIAKPVKCETDGKVFRTTKEAAKHYGISPTTITNICQGISSGKLLKLKFSYHGEAN